MEAVHALLAGAQRHRLNAALRISAFAGQLLPLQLLSQAGAQIDSPDPHGRTAVGWAAYLGHEAVFQWLVGQGASLLTHEWRAPHYCPVDLLVWRGHLTLLRWLLSQAHGPSSALHAALLRALLIEPQLPRAARAGHLSLSLHLLSLGAAVDGVDELGKTALSHAAEGRHAGLCAALMGQGASLLLLSPSALSELLCTLAPSHPSELREVIAAGAPVGLAGVCGLQPMQWALLRGQMASVELLGLAGADILAPLLTARPTRPSHPVHAAVVEERVPSMGLCDVDVIEAVRSRDERGKTLLHQTVRSARHACLPWLLEYHSLPLTPDCEGRLPLHDACELGEVALVSALLDGSGGGEEELAAEDVHGLLPSELAPLCSRELRSLLQSRGAPNSWRRLVRTHMPRAVGLVVWCVILTPLLPVLTLAAMLRCGALEGVPAMLIPLSREGGESGRVGGRRGVRALDPPAGVAAMLALAWVGGGQLFERAPLVLGALGLLFTQADAMRVALTRWHAPPSPPLQRDPLVQLVREADGRGAGEKASVWGESLREAAPPPAPAEAACLSFRDLIELAAQLVSSSQASLPSPTSPPPMRVHTHPPCVLTNPSTSHPASLMCSPTLRHSTRPSPMCLPCWREG